MGENIRKSYVSYGVNTENRQQIQLQRGNQTTQFKNRQEGLNRLFSSEDVQMANRQHSGSKHHYSSNHT